MKPKSWTNVLRTNLDSAFHITQEVVKKMIRAQWGRIINISSIVGLMGNPGQVNYASSKAAMIGFTKALALEIGSRNITVNAIAPGFISTAMTDQMTDDARKTLESRIALRRLGTVDDIAYASCSSRPSRRATSRDGAERQRRAVYVVEIRGPAGCRGRIVLWRTMN